MSILLVAYLSSNDLGGLRSAVAAFVAGVLELRAFVPTVAYHDCGWGGMRGYLWAATPYDVSISK